MMKEFPLSSYVFILDILAVSGKVCKLQGRGICRNLRPSVLLLT